LFEIPLLFETGREGGMDEIWLTLAPKPMQRRRALARPGMTEARFNAIRATQLPDSVKRKHADLVIHTGLGLAYTARIVKQRLSAIRKASR
jgi:dephospho-CoA kinase